MLNYHYLRYFWIVAHEGNLTRAAEKISIAQSALSMQIRKLEGELGQPLFERQGRRLILTEAGRIALEFADSIFATGEELLGTLNQLAQPQRRTMRIGALATLSRNFQLQFVAPFLAQEEVEVVIRSGTLGDLLRSLEEYQIDVLLSIVEPLRDANTRWISHAIDRQPVSLVGSPQAKWQGRPLADLLAQEPLALPTLDSSIRTGFDALVSRLGVRPHIVAEVDDMAMLRLVARSHNGLAVVPPIVVKDELDSGILVEVAKLPGLEETFFAITSTRRFPNPLLTLVLHT
ncbi:MAG: LysR family transcriptional regulator, partial [Caldilineaceae bacterium]|nr:LysR family transcriptional regulator [Caldilineaceae bacterium]